MAQFSRLQDKVTPGVANYPQQLLFKEVIIQGGQIWVPYARIRHVLAVNRTKSVAIITAPGLTLFSNDKKNNLISFSFSPSFRVSRKILCVKMFTTHNFRLDFAS